MGIWLIKPVGWGGCSGCEPFATEADRLIARQPSGVRLVQSLGKKRTGR